MKIVKMMLISQLIHKKLIIPRKILLRYVLLVLLVMPMSMEVIGMVLVHHSDHRIVVIILVDVLLPVYVILEV